MIETMPYNHDKNDHYLVKVNRDLKCVCQLCNCGKHKCPRQQIKGDFTTSYANHYQKYKVIPLVQPNQYKYSERHYNPQVLKTNYQQAYVPVAVEEPPMSRSRMSQVGKQIMKSEPFQGASSYKEEFKPFRVEVEEEPSGSRMRLADSRERPSIKFQGETSYKSAYHEVPMPKLERYKHPQYKKSAPFQGESSYKSAFPNFRVETNNDGPYYYSNQKQVRFNGTSSYRNDYGTFKVVPKEQVQVVGCKLDQLSIPTANYLNSSKHVYYDSAKNKFI